MIAQASKLAPPKPLESRPVAALGQAASRFPNLISTGLLHARLSGQMKSSASVSVFVCMCINVCMHVCAYIPLHKYLIRTYLYVCIDRHMYM